MRNPLIANTPAADYINALAIMETLCVHQESGDLESSSQHLSMEMAENALTVKDVWDALVS